MSLACKVHCRVLSMSAIEIENLTKDYPVGFWRKRLRRGLDGLTLTVETGETFGLLGPNGAGKTTTLKLLMRLIYPTAGTARLLGRSIDDIEVHQRI
ncbi:MAG: ATP-binding cassette domain-containing protein, partial [Acidobacteria bacterium]|nr:ATP-binding cassette domain-containing protein [Acidobacteriota bacterium]